jgi:hypothetical protein
MSAPFSFKGWLAAKSYAAQECDATKASSLLYTLAPNSIKYIVGSIAFI